MLRSFEASTVAMGINIQISTQMLQVLFEEETNVVSAAPKKRGKRLRKSEKWISYMALKSSHKNQRLPLMQAHKSVSVSGKASPRGRISALHAQMPLGCDKCEM